MSINEIAKSTLTPGFEKKNQNPDEISEQSEAALVSLVGPPKEVGGRIGPDPTRYGDWEKNGRCIDF